MTASRPLSLGVLISGEGTGLQNLIDRIADGRLGPARIAVVISSRADAGGVTRAKRAGLPVEIIRRSGWPAVDAFSGRIVTALEARGVTLGVQAGWVCYWRLPDHWLRRVINIHPALLPKFGGKGFYGRRVHEAVLAAGDRVSGATVHWVDNEYDHGEIILQRACTVEAGDTAATLAERVRSIEFDLLPEVILRIHREWSGGGEPSRLRTI
jgi:formyltetrahydrofolate-dependent phosphoribosylglycinamide formyltransferase